MSQSNKNQIMFSSDDLSNQKESPLIMDSIFVGKSVGVDTNRVKKLH